MAAFWELTDAELVQLSLIAYCLGDTEIAASMGVTLRTVKGRNHTIFDKLYVKDRLNAALCAWRIGVVSIDEAWKVVRPNEPPCPEPPAREPVVLVGYAPQTRQEAWVLARFYFEMAETLPLKVRS